MAAWFEGDNRDGARLARLVQRHPQHLGLVRLAARKIERGQGELLEWLRWGDKGWMDRPASFAITTAQLRDLASTLGEAALAREHDATAGAYHRGLARRDIAVQLAVLSLQ